jgi:hypothetical protein
MAWAEAAVRTDRLYGVRDERSAVIRVRDIPDYYHACARERIHDPYFQTVVVGKTDPLSDSLVRTNYIPLYRMHARQYFYRGDDFPSNWEPSERKRHRADRYSPFGTEAHYFSLTLQGAENEALYYGDGALDSNKLVLLVLNVCLDGILDLLSGQLAGIWRLADLDPDAPVAEMYLRLMDPSTDNQTTNAIGLWARKQPGVNGIIYPSARYGQLDWASRGIARGLKPAPMINRVIVGSQIDRTYVMGALELAHAVFAAHAMPERGEFPVSAEANIALFDAEQLLGREWPVFYQTCHFDDRAEIEEEDDRGRQQNFPIRFGSDTWFEKR